jgi:hypothetical protein
MTKRANVQALPKFQGATIRGECKNWQKPMALTDTVQAPKCQECREKPHIRKRAIAEALPKFHGAPKAGEPNNRGPPMPPPRGTGLASKSASAKNAKILASRVLTLMMDSNKSLDGEPNNKDKLLLEESEGKSHNGTQLRFSMEALQQLVYTKGSVASIFANIVSKAQMSSQDFVKNFNAAIADIFTGMRTPTQSLLPQHWSGTHQKGKPT